MIPLNRKSKIPLYKQIYDDLNSRIQQGEYPLGSMLPSENKLCGIYGVERATVRRALAIMVDDGKIARIPGLGTSVIDPSQNNEFSKKKNLLFLLPKGIDNSDRIREPFNAKLMSTLDHECARRGYTLLYKSYSESDTVEDLIQTCNPKGVFYTSSLATKRYNELYQRGIPVVFLNEGHRFYPSVCLDNRDGVRMLMEYLFELGHRKIGFISGFPEGQNQVSRFNGYKEALEVHGLPYKKEWILEGNWTTESGKKAIRKLLENDDLPTAVFAANDEMAIGAIMEMKNMGLSVPEDMSIVGFDNIDQSSFMSPPLTTVAVDYDAMARAGCMLLFDMIEHDNIELNVNIYTSVKLLVRQSTRGISTD